MGSFSWYHWLILAGIAWLLWEILSPIFRAFGPDMVCKRCGTVAPPKMHTKGSSAIELVLWLFLILPGVIYSLWRLSSRGKVCPACGADELVPVDSPIGRKLLSDTTIGKPHP